MQVLPLLSFVTLAFSMAAANEASQQKRLLSGGSSPLDEVTQVLPIKRLLPGGDSPLDGLTGALPLGDLPLKRLVPGEASPLDELTDILPLKRLVSGDSNPLDAVTEILPIKRLVPGESSPLDELTDILPIKRLVPGEASPLDELTEILPIKRLSTDALPLSSLTSSLQGVTAIKRAVEELVAQEKRLSTESVPGADVLDGLIGGSGILGGGLPLKRQADLLNELGGLGGLASAVPLSKRLVDGLTGAEGILSGGLPTKRQLDILNSLGGLAGLASLPEKRQLDILKSLSGSESDAESEFKRQLDLLDSLLPGTEGLPIKRDHHHNKRIQLALRALPGADAITGILSSGTESQKRALDALSALPGADTVTSLASGALPTRRQLDLLNSLGGIGGLLGQPVKKQLGILQTLGGVTDPSDLLTRRENLNGEAMKYVHTLLAERSTDGKGQRPVTRAAANTSTGDCSVGKAQCCDQVINDKSKKKTLGLAGLNEIAGSIALSCTQLPIGILPIAAQNTCKSSPVCCNSVTQDGLVNFGCISLPVN